MRHWSLLLAGLAIQWPSLGCSSTKGGGNNGQADAQANGGEGGAAAGASSVAGGGAGGSSAGQGGNAGELSSGGMAGAAGVGGSVVDAGSDGSVEVPDASPLNCEELGSPGRTGRQCYPGTDGNGIFQQAQPPADGVPPEAMDQGNPHGVMLAAQTKQSTIYGYGFVYQVYVPAEYQPGKPAALMIFQDGGNYPFTFNFITVLDNLIVSGEMPVTIGVFINPGNDRSAEYDSLDDKYARFLLQELIPDIGAQYDLVDDPNGWAIGGHSSGGICAFTVGWHYPDKFRKIMTHSGSFTDIRGGDQYPSMIAAADRLPLRVTLQSGTNDLNGWFAANDAMAAALAAKGYPFRYMRGQGMHDPVPWDTYDFPNALRWLWRGYTLPQYAQ